MTMESRLASLDQRHHEVQTALDAEMSHPSADDLRLNDLKRQKLRIKDEITKLRARCMSAPST